MYSVIVSSLFLANVYLAVLGISFNFGRNNLRTLKDKNINAIVEGSVPWRFQFPYIVDLKVSVGNSVYSCGASLISQNYVLTAAHCYYGHNAEKVTVRFGANRILLPMEFGRYEMDIPQKNIKIHEAYTPKTYVNDIALIKLPKSAYLSAYVKVVKLPKRTDIEIGQIKTTGTVAGWGRTGINSASSSRLLYTDVEILTFDDCNNFYKTWVDNGLTLDKGQMCASGYLTGGTTCTGDSGGPLILKDKNPPIQVGIVSAGGSTCQPLVPTIYTNIVHYLDWINENSDVVIE